MAYRGEDLDLRTARTGIAGSSDAGWQPGDAAGRARGPGGRGPIWVDDTVLACANHAFDVALAHRAAEVRPEHLIYALTRIEAAAERLERCGVRVASLRRETATAIASDIPVGLPVDSAAAPRRSEALEDALRLASAEAARRNAPATPEDLVTVFLDIRPDLPGSGLLARHTLRIARDLPGPLPSSRAVGHEPRYAEAVEPVRERVRMPAGSYYLSGSARPVRAEPPALDAAQHARVDALEQMVRALASDLGGGLHERLQSIEHALVTGRGEAGGQQMLDRLQAIEVGMDRRLAELSRGWSVLSDRMAELEMALSARAAGPADLGPITDRLDIIEEALLSPDRAGAGDTTERLASIERLVQSQRAEIIAETEVLKSDVAGLAKLMSAQLGRAEPTEALAGLVDRSRGETIAAVTGPLLQRLNALAGVAETQHKDLAGVLAQLSERMAAAERALTATVQRSEESHKTYAHELSELHEALVKLNTNQHTLAGSIDQWKSHVASELSLVSKRLEGVEQMAAGPLPVLEQMSASMEAMHRITVARHHRRNRFWYWLLGTDDWVAASWPSQLAKMEAERDLVKSVRP